MGHALIHPHALCEFSNVGDDTRVWAFAHILSGARIGRNCNICDGVFIENDVLLGDDVTVKCGVQLWDGLRVGNGVFIGPNATFTNDRAPRSKIYPPSFPETIIHDGASIGANATILPGITIGARAMIGAGAVVLYDVPPRATVVGNPGKVVGYAGALQCSETANGELTLPLNFSASMVEFIPFKDHRGRLTVADNTQLPFKPRRLFVVDQVPSGNARGGHAHRRCHQLLIALAGTLTAVADDGRQAFEIELDTPVRGLHLRPLTWGLQFRHSQDAVLLVLASDPYDRNDYISDYSEFLQEASLAKPE